VKYLDQLGWVGALGGMWAGENYNGVDNETGGGQTLSLEYVLFLSRSSNAKMILWPFSEENSYVTLTDEIGATSMDYGAYIS
jgi:hypothetical protein